jgi:hypothetical protein
MKALFLNRLRLGLGLIIILSFNAAQASENFGITRLVTFNDHPDAEGDLDDYTLALAIHPLSGELYFLRSNGDLSRIEDQGSAIVSQLLLNLGEGKDLTPERRANTSWHDLFFHPTDGKLFTSYADEQLRVVLQNEEGGLVSASLCKEQGTIKLDFTNPNSALATLYPSINPLTGELYYADNFGIRKIARPDNNNEGDQKPVMVIQDVYNFDEEEGGPMEMSFHPVSGELYFIVDDIHTNNAQIRKLQSFEGEHQAIIVAGARDENEDDDNLILPEDGPALTASIEPSSLKFHPLSGELYFLDESIRIRKIIYDENGIAQIVTVVGSLGAVDRATPPEDGPALTRHILITDFQFDPRSGELWLIANHHVARLVERHGFFELQTISVPEHRASQILVHPHSGNVYFVENRVVSLDETESIGVIYPITIREVPSLKQLAAEAAYDGLETILKAPIAATSAEAHVRRLRKAEMRKREREDSHLPGEDDRRVRARVDNGNDGLN